MPSASCDAITAIGQDCLALQFGQIQAPKKSQSTSHNRIRYQGTNRSSVILSSPCCSGQRSRITFFLSDRSLRSNQFFSRLPRPGFPRSRLGVGRRSRKFHACQVAQSAQKMGGDCALGLGLASPDANFRAVRPRWISWASWHHHTRRGLAFEPFSPPVS